MANDDPVVRRALVEVNKHRITTEMIAAHALWFMPSMAGNCVEFVCIVKTGRSYSFQGKITLSYFEINDIKIIMVLFTSPGTSRYGRIAHGLEHQQLT